MKICEIFGIGTVRPSVGHYQTPHRDLEFAKKKAKPKKKDDEEKKKVKSSVEKGQGKTVDIEV